MQPIGDNTANTPAFLGKLWKMVNDPSTDQLICWSASGNSFVIQNQASFWYELLPLYYKHNNMSSFVRQLNMYGFHKVPTVENGSMDTDKDEIQFFHPFFQRDQPELLKNIKRKATAQKITTDPDSKHNDLNKVLNDVKQLRGRQDNIDSQLSAMKQENGLVWRELAFLRQKHLKQQKIVNKLIQFLVTLVQPARMTVGSVGVKRGYQLMLHESPNKKSKSSNSKENAEGPTIHELDSENVDTNTQLYEEETPLIDSPTTANIQTDLNSPLSSVFLPEGNSESVPETNWDKPEYVTIHSRAAAEDMIISDNELAEENLMNTLEHDSSNLSKENSQKIFLNPSAQNTMLINLMKNNDENGELNKSSNDTNGQKTSENLNGKQKPKMSTSAASTSKSDLTVATRESNVCDVIKSMPSTSDFYCDDLDSHIETTQSELDQLKEILNGTLDANALLGELSKIPLNYQDNNLFSDQTPDYGLNINQEKGGDPLVSGSELATYGSNLIDFNELFDDSLDAHDANIITSENVDSTVTTPQVLKQEPIFPKIEKP